METPLHTLDLEFAIAVQAARKGKVDEYGNVTLAKSVTDEERASVEKLSPYIALMRPGITWAQCTSCKRRRLVKDSTSEGKCSLTMLCNGKLVTLKSNSADKIRDALADR